jgi:hypothetical protein
MKNRRNQVTTLVLSAIAIIFVGLSPAYAGADFDIALNALTHNGISGTADMGLDINLPPPEFLGFSGNEASHVTSFDVSIDNLTFNLSNGSVSTLTFFDTSVIALGYTGTVLKNGIKDVLTLSRFLGVMDYTLDQTKENCSRRCTTTLASGTLDINPDMIAVPEPPTWSLLLAGLVAMGGMFLLRRRRGVVA